MIRRCKRLLCVPLALLLLLTAACTPVENLNTSSPASEANASSAQTPTAAVSSWPPNDEVSKEPRPPLAEDDVGRFWMMPHKSTFRDLTTNLGAWQQTAAVIDVMGFAEHDLINRYTPDQLREGFALMRELNLPLGIETGAIKEWGYEAGSGGSFGQKMFNAESGMWDTLISYGAEIAGFAFDEPLLCVLRTYYPADYVDASKRNRNVFVESVMHPSPGRDDLIFSSLPEEDLSKLMQFAAEQVALLIKLMRAKYP